MLRTRRLPRKALLAAALVGGAGAGGCSAERRYAVMSALLDGVPPPGSSPGDGRGVSPQYVGMQQAGRGPSVVKGYFHPPYLQKKCGECHPRDRSLWIQEEKKQKLCHSCHEHDTFWSEVEGYQYVHGPVIALACLRCHDPHESDYPGLLVEEGDPKICLGCHESPVDPSLRGHEDFSETECLPCHDPHGGDNRYFLRGEARG